MSAFKIIDELINIFFVVVVVVVLFFCFVLRWAITRVLGIRFNARFSSRHLVLALVVLQAKICLVFVGPLYYL